MNAPRDWTLLVPGHLGVPVGPQGPAVGLRGPTVSPTVGPPRTPTKGSDISRTDCTVLKIADILGFFTGVVHDFDQRFIKTRPFRQIDPTTQWTDSENANASVFAYFHGFSIRERKSG